MRVISGSCKGRKLSSPPGKEIRPTSDMLKGMLFNILAPQIVDSHFVDLCAGSGAIGIEAVSRGAALATFVESSAEALTVLRRNIEICRIAERCQVIAGDVRSLGSRWHYATAVDIVYFDPPYHSDMYDAVLRQITSASWLNADALVIVEHHREQRLNSRYAAFTCYRHSVYGLSQLSFYRRESEESKVERS